MSYWAAAGNLLRHFPAPYSLNGCFQVLLCSIRKTKTMKFFHAENRRHESRCVSGCGDGGVERVGLWILSAEGFRSAGLVSRWHHLPTGVRVIPALAGG